MIGKLKLKLKFEINNITPRNKFKLKKKNVVRAFFFSADIGA